VFGLGIATVLTLIFTPSMLALRVWVSVGAYKSFAGLKALSMGRSSRSARDIALNRAARKIKHPEILWETEVATAVKAERDAEIPAEAEDFEKSEKIAKPKTRRKQTTKANTNAEPDVKEKSSGKDSPEEPTPPIKAAE